MAHIQSQRSGEILAERAALNVSLLRAAADHLAEARESGAFDVSIGGQTYRLRAVDTGGLIDLNTAAPPLLEAYLTAMGLTDAEIRRFRDWRRGSKRLLRIGDLIRVSGAQSIDWEQFLRTATVYSGRSGAARDEMPDELWEMLERSWQQEWETAASGVNFEVFRDQDARDLPLGSVRAGSDGAAKLLFVR